MIIFLLFGTIHVFWWGSQKQGFYVDELYTYGLSNSYKIPFYERTENFLNAYHSGNEFWEYLTVSDMDKFKFDSVWYNQEQDVHPPFYYFLFHLVSSIFSETFSKWIGLGINYIFWVLSVLVFYKICVRLFQTKTNIILAVFMYIFSVGTLSCFLFIRMYMMLVFWILLYLWVMMCFVLNEAAKLRVFFYYVLIGSIIVCGFLTHYYFLVPAGILSFLYVVYCLFEKQIKNALYYILTCIAAAVATQYIFEYSYNHIFIGYRGVEALRNIRSANFFANIGEMYYYTNEQLFGGMFSVIVLLIAVSYIILSYRKRKNSIGYKKDENKKGENKRVKKTSVFWIKTAILITMVMFFVFVTKTAAPLEARSRYLFPVYPFMILSFFMIADRMLRRSQDQVIRIIMVVSTVACVVSSYYFGDNKEFLFNKYAHIPDVIEENYQGSNAIYVTDCSYRHVADSHILAMHGDIYIADFNTVDSMAWFADDIVILYVNRWAYEPMVGEAVHDLDYYLSLGKLAGYESCEYLGDTEHSAVYVLAR